MRAIQPKRIAIHHREGCVSQSGQGARHTAAGLKQGFFPLQRDARRAARIHASCDLIGQPMRVHHCIRHACIRQPIQRVIKQATPSQGQQGFGHGFR